MIYEYALTEDNGLMYQKDEHGVRKLYVFKEEMQNPVQNASPFEPPKMSINNVAGDVQEANQLRLVNRQLYSETRV